MGEWTNTTYVQHPSAADVARALARLVESEGLRRDEPAPRERLPIDPMQYDDALHNDLWALAVFPGAPGWTVVKTAPLALLAERRPGGERMRLADLCRDLGASAVYLRVSDGHQLLVEVSRDGAVLLSGLDPYDTGCNREPPLWRGEPMDVEHLEPTFRLHASLQDVLAPSSAATIARLAARLGGANAAHCDELLAVTTLIAHDPLPAAGGIALYFRWPGPSRQRWRACRTWEEQRAQRPRS
jgi:hypothetical protein